jgi:hypothetical protein
MSNNICVVFLCNKSYFNKFINSCQQLITNDNLLDCDII